MYQSIDDPQDEEAPEGRYLPMFAWLIGLIALLAVITVIYMGRGKIDGPVKTPVVNTEARQTYIKALGEINPAMRRARLQDFMRVYPNSPRAEAVLSQLAVIDLHDSEAWDEVTQVYYDDRLPKEVKTAALDQYDKIWGGALLGARSEEIETLRTELAAEPDELTKPDRRMAQAESPIPTNIRSDAFAGAPRRVVTFVPPPPKPAAPIVKKDPNIGVYEPKIRRDVKPKYPGRAWRKKVPGVVKLRLDIDETGQVVSTELISVKARRYEKNFVKVSERAAMKTRYFPKVVDGKPVPAKGIIKTYTFERD